MNAATTHANLYDVLLERGLVAQATDEKIRGRLDSPVSAYIGFDPTADSLHVGSLVPDHGPGPPAALRAQAGRPRRRSDGLVGDPSGKTQARRMLSADDIDTTPVRSRSRSAAIVDFEGTATLPGRRW